VKVMALSHSSAPDSFGGAEKSLVQLIDQWAELRPTTEFFVVSRTPEGRLQAELDQRHVEHHSLDFGSWVLSLVEAGRWMQCSMREWIPALSRRSRR